VASADRKQCVVKRRAGMCAAALEFVDIVRCSFGCCKGGDNVSVSNSFVNVFVRA
jgi:hypothetical protein